MADPFRDRTAGKRARRLGVGSARRKRAFLEELETLLATADSLNEVAIPVVRRLAQTHKIDLGADVTTARRAFYRRFLEHCLNDFALSADESGELAHLQALLALRESDVNIAKEEAVRSVYGRALDAVLEDYQLDPDEEGFLLRLQKEMGLSTDSAQALLGQKKQQLRERFIRDTQVYEGHVVMAPQRTEVDLQGESEISLEDAVRAALARATGALPDIRSAVVRDLRVEITGGAISKWSVTLRAQL